MIKPFLHSKMHAIRLFSTTIFLCFSAFISVHVSIYVIFIQQTRNFVSTISRFKILLLALPNFLWIFPAIYWLRCAKPFLASYPCVLNFQVSHLLLVAVSRLVTIVINPEIEIVYMLGQQNWSIVWYQIFNSGHDPICNPILQDLLVFHIAGAL